MAYLLTPMFRVSYPKVFKAEINKLNGKSEFSLQALFKKGEDLSAMEAEIIRVTKEKFGDEAKIVKTEKGYGLQIGTGKASLFRLPFRDQGEKEDENGNMPNGYEKGAKFLTLRSLQQPGLVNQQRQPIIDASEFYAGCYARAAVSAYAYDQMGNKGVSFGLQNLQKMKEGEPFGNRVKAEDCFQPVEMDAAADAGSLFS